MQKHTCCPPEMAASIAAFIAAWLCIKSLNGSTRRCDQAPVTSLWHAVAPVPLYAGAVGIIVDGGGADVARSTGGFVDAGGAGVAAAHTMSLKQCSPSAQAPSVPSQGVPHLACALVQLLPHHMRWSAPAAIGAAGVGGAGTGVTVAHMALPATCCSIGGSVVVPVQFHSARLKSPTPGKFFSTTRLWQAIRAHDGHAADGAAPTSGLPI